MRRSVFLIVVIAATLLIVVVSVVFVRGWGEAFVAHGPLPSPPSGSPAFAGVPPQHPFQKDASGA
jgi:hypothetical protein